MLPIITEDEMIFLLEHNVWMDDIPAQERIERFGHFILNIAITNREDVQMPFSYTARILSHMMQWVLENENDAIVANKALEMFLAVLVRESLPLFIDIEVIREKDLWYNTYMCGYVNRRKVSRDGYNIDPYY